ncbi:hypothetical protein NA57DRAFT_56301 [Rhizodiscina lignyota]|uniref:Uncharacterized protein n=1 Tax=Rhizodiscina lignyota TaxID=1504668 RepID=A0A9P4IG17_9PEZI|nr:hypothetical protein NA57DRAFT_56301 [Rhizodiscina lignyota]
MGRRPRLWKVAHACLTLCLLRYTSAIAVRPSLAYETSIHLFARDTTCGGDSNYRTCGGDLPSNWCCSTGSTCIPLNNTGTEAVICCPQSDSGKCTTIQPISCDISKQNASVNPHSELFTQDLSQKLGTCGQGTCCPLGYSCKDDTCVMDEETKQSPGAKAPAESSQSLPPSTVSPPLSTSSTPSAVSSTPSSLISDTTPPNATPTPQNTSDYPARAVLAGLFPGIILGALLGAAIFFYVRHRSNKRLEASERNSQRSSFGDRGFQQQRPRPPPPPPVQQRDTHVHWYSRYSNHLHPQQYGRNISDPIFYAQTPNRTDFLKQSRGSDHTSSSDSANKTLGPVTPEQNQRWYRRSPRLSPRLPMGTWSSTVTVPTLSTPNPQKHRENRAALNELTPTPQGRGVLNPAPYAPGLAITTPSSNPVRDFLRPISPSMQSIKSFHARTKSAERAAIANGSPQPARNASGKSTTTTIASRSTSGRNLSRRETATSGETINFLLAPSAMSTVPLRLGNEVRFQDDGPPPRPPSKISEEGPSATLAAPWIEPAFSIPGSPIDRGGDRETLQRPERMTRFTTLMLDAGFAHGSPGKAIART